MVINKMPGTRQSSLIYWGEMDRASHEIEQGRELNVGLLGKIWKAHELNFI